jgi:hypothetical protein
VEANWDAIAHELDCQLIRPGMTREDVEESLRAIGDFQVLKMHDTNHGSSNVIYAFSDPITAAALMDRLCIFQDGRLESISYGRDSDWFKTSCGP